jgi:tetratricopeptide (TPR) repeat protein
MAKKNKITRKQLLKEPDEFLSFSAKLVQFISQYRYPLLIVVGAVIVSAMAISAIRYYGAKMERAAFSSLAAVKTEYRATLEKSGPADAYESVQSKIEQLIAKHGHRDGGRYARLFYANICYRNGQFKKAIDLYQQVLEDETVPFMRNQTLTSLGYAYEAIGDYQSAGNYYEMVSQSGVANLRAEALFNLSRMYMAMGQSDQSKAAIKRILQDHPESMYIDMINERLGS